VLRDWDSDGGGSLDERLYAVQDANWNVVALPNTSGAVLERFAYEAYGQPIELDDEYIPQADIKDWDTRFTGQRFDRDTALYLFRNRYYHDLLGRFVTRDPFQGEANLYCYCANNPVVGVDPSGLFTVEGPRGYRREGEPKDLIGGRFVFNPNLAADGPFVIQDVVVTGSLVCTTSDGCYNAVGFRYSWTEVWSFGKKVEDTHLNSPQDVIAFLKDHCPCPCDLKKPWTFTATAEFVVNDGMRTPKALGFSVTPVDATTTYRCEGASDEGTSINGKGAIMSMYPGKRAADPTASTPLSRSTLTRLGNPGYATDTWVCINGKCKYTSTGYRARGGAGK
jgi:RHS repeat-associated protein